MNARKETLVHERMECFSHAHNWVEIARPRALGQMSLQEVHSLFFITNCVKKGRKQGLSQQAFPPLSTIHHHYFQSVWLCKMEGKMQVSSIVRSSQYRIKDMRHPPPPPKRKKNHQHNTTKINAWSTAERVGLTSHCEYCSYQYLLPALHFKVPEWVTPI